jgi:fructose-1,6-bisphosphatase/inositol monophosphatase family enzyme
VIDVDDVRARYRRAILFMDERGRSCLCPELLALGQIDIMAEGDMKLWDWAALVPVTEGASGRVTGQDGAPLRPEGPPTGLGRYCPWGDPHCCLRPSPSPPAKPRNPCHKA